MLVPQPLTAEIVRPRLPFGPMNHQDLLPVAKQIASAYAAAACMRDETERRLMDSCRLRQDEILQAAADCAYATRRFTECVNAYNLFAESNGYTVNEVLRSEFGDNAHGLEAEIVRLETELERIPLDATSFDDVVAIDDRLKFLCAVREESKPARNDAARHMAPGLPGRIELALRDGALLPGEVTDQLLADRDWIEIEYRKRKRFHGLSDSRRLAKLAWLASVLG